MLLRIDDVEDIVEVEAVITPQAERLFLLSRWPGLLWGRGGIEGR